MNFLKKKNNARTSLTGDINNTDLSFSVTDASLFPVSGDFFITIWDLTNYSDPIDDSNTEILKVTNVSGNVFTVLRGQDNTTAHSHNSGSTVEMLITKGHFEELENEINNKLNIGSTTADVDSFLNRRYVSDANLVTISNTSGVNTGDQDLSSYLSISSASSTYIPLSYIDTDNTLANNSDTKLASQKAIKSYVTTGLSTKQNSLTIGNLTESTSSVLTITGGTNAIIGSGLSIQVKQASTTVSGYLSSTDWNTFNNKQPAGSYLTSSTGVSSINKTGNSTLHGAITLTAGSNITLTQTGNDISIAASGGGSQTPWTSDIVGSGYNLTGVGLLNGIIIEIEGVVSSITPPSSIGVDIVYTSLAAPSGISGSDTPGSYSFYIPDYPTTSPDLNVTVYAYEDIDDFSTWSSANYTFNFPSPSPTGGVAEVTTITTVADVLGSLDGKSFNIVAPGGNNFYVWINVDGLSSDPGGSGVPIEVPISMGDNANTVADSIHDVINGKGFFTCGIGGNVVTVTNDTAGAVTDASDVDSGFALLVTTQGVDPDDYAHFGADLTWTAVVGAIGYAIVVATSDPLSIGTVYIYFTATNSISLDGSTGGEDFGVAVYPDTRPIADGTSTDYNFFAFLLYHGRTLFSATSTTFTVTDDNSGRTISAKDLSWTVETPGGGTYIQNPDGDFTYAGGGESYDLLQASYGPLDVSNNQYYSNETKIFSDNLEVDPDNAITKVWGKLQFETLQAAGSSALPGGVALVSGATAGGTDIVGGTAAIGDGGSTIVFGIQSQARGPYCISMGDNAYNLADSVGGIVLGGSSTIERGGRGVIIGPGNYMMTPVGEGSGCIIGSGNQDYGVSTSTIGVANYNTGNNNGLLGALINMSASASYAMGFNFAVTEDHTINFGDGSLWARYIDGDLEIMDFNKGIILHSPDDTRWRVQINDLGVLTSTPL